MMIFGSALARRLAWAGLAEYNDGCRRGHIPYKHMIAKLVWLELAVVCFFLHIACGEKGPNLCWTVQDRKSSSRASERPRPA